MKKSTRNFLMIFNIAAMTYVLAVNVSRHMNQPREECAPVPDAITLVEKLPKAARDLATLSSLPISGEAIRQLQEPNTQLRLCRVSQLPGGNAAGAYSPIDKTMRMLESHSNPYVLSHELFHAGQDIRGVLTAISNPALTIEDQLAANLVIEATAVGYTHMAFKELDSRSPGAYAAFAASDYSFHRGAEFTKAYDLARAAGADEKESLRAGGTAVVEALLSGADEHWRIGYLLKSAENYFAAKSPAAPSSRRADPDYQEKMADYFNKAATISEGVTILPEELKGAKPVAVDGMLSRMGLQVPSA